MNLNANQEKLFKMKYKEKNIGGKKKNTASVGSGVTSNSLLHI